MKLPLWATVFAILGIVVLCGLGIWQLERLVWKRNILDQVEKEYAQNINMAPLSASDFKIKEGFKRGYVEGVFLHAQEILIRPRIYDGRLGYHVLTPFLIEGEEAPILINRGWIPVESEMPKDKVVERPENKVRVVGMVRPAPGGNWFTPENDMAGGLWYNINPSEVFKMYKVNGIGPRILYEEGADNGSFPIPPPKLTMSNNHAQYAIFWFLMAFALATVYWVRFFSKVLK